MNRCAWASQPLEMTQYHDREWGVPVTDDRRHFEFLCLESAQAGLSWLTILRRREGYRACFANFDFEAVARFDEADIQRLLTDERIIRNKLKVNAAVNNARCFLEICEEFDSFTSYIWRFVDGRPVQNAWESSEHIPATSPQSLALAKDLKKRGFKFLGPTTIYAHMQAAGLVNDHEVSCFRSAEIQAMGAQLTL